MSRRPGYLKHVDEHEVFLLETMPYDMLERQRVIELFEQERLALVDRVNGEEFNLAGLRFAIADERRLISRAANKRRISHGRTS